MQELDKGAMGKRIRQIRLGAKLRQWELAKLLGTTQSAVHKYEHGVVPEPRRLVELARIGGTSIEWVLTGRHWENGSDEQERISPELLNTACILREISDEGRATVNEALRIVREAVNALEKGLTDNDTASAPATASLRSHAKGTLQLLESAWRIQRAVLRRVAEDAEERLGNAQIFFDRRNATSNSAKDDKAADGA
jgi:transcriptional regulator with XRE-family HTH domain